MNISMFLRNDRKAMNVLSLVVMRPRKLGTVEEYCLFLSDRLSRDGRKAVFGFSEPPPDWLHAMFLERGGTVEVVDFTASPWGLFRQIRKLVDKHDIGIVHSTFLDIFSPLPFLLKASHRVKILFSDQTSRVQRGQPTIVRIIKGLRNRIRCRSIDLILADAEFIKEDLIKNSMVPRRKVKTVYNGVNTHRFLPNADQREARRQLGLGEASKIITTVAQCIPEKGLIVFLDAAAKIVHMHDRSQFLIVGDGPLLEKLKNLSSDLGLGGRVSFLGLRNDVQRILQATDIFVLCSLWQEAFAFSLLEAMAAGCPVVASNIGAIPESVKDGETGILFPPGDAEAAAKAIKKLLDDEGLRRRMSLAARKRVEDKFNMETWIDETMRVYQSLGD